MAHQHRGTTLLAMFMFVLGGGSLFVCIFLPPWFELRHLRETYADSELRVAELERHLEGVTRQIEHLRSDPAYVERIGRAEFGIETPGVDIIPVKVTGGATSRPAIEEGGGSGDLGGLVERAAHENPLVAVFVIDETRPIVIAMSSGLLIVALAVLIRQSWRA